MKRAADTPRPVGDFSHALRPHPLREAGLYGLAATAIVALHAGVAAWAMQAQPEPMSDAPPADAVMIDLAPEPQAPIAEETQQTNQQVDSMAPETDPVDPPDALEQVEAEAPPDLAEDVPPPDEIVEDVPEIEELQPQELPEIDTAEAVIPVKPKVEKKKPAPPKKTPPKESVRETAKQPPQAAGGSQKWQNRLMAHLEKRKRYPAAAKRRRDEGVATVRFSIDPAGNVLSVSLARSSGIPELDEEVVAMVRRASPVPTPPPGAKLDVSVPVRFNIR